MLLTSPRKCERGLTIIEITVVIGLLLGLVSALFVGVSAYKEGANRAMCIQSISLAQRAMRAYCNLYELNPGDSAPNLKQELTKKGGALEFQPDCPTGGMYFYAEGVVPPTGSTLITCSLTGHHPDDTAGW